MGQDQSRLRNGQAGAAGAQGNANGAAAGVAGSQGSAVATVPLAGIEGFQIVRLLPFSPAHAAGLVPYFDIITSLDHVLLESEGKPALQFFKSYIANHRDQPVCFTVFNLHIRAYRDVYCVPSDAWGGGGLLGCSIEWSRADACPERCVHVVDVLEGSPAARSGELLANRDYIIGMQTAQEPLISLIKNQKDFYSRLEGWHEEQRWTLERKQRFPQEAVDVPHILLFLVYNSESNTVKEVAVEMGTNPEAALGMSVATGLLHIIPSAATAGDASTASSLPVMNKFVRLEANQAITSTPEAPAPPALPHPPTEDRQPRQPQLEGQRSPPQSEAAPHGAESSAPPEQPPSELEAPRAAESHSPSDGPVHESVSAPLQVPLSSTQPPLDVMAAGPAPPPPPPDYHAVNAAASLPPPPPSMHPQHMPSHPAYPMPPSIPDNFIPPPRDPVPPSHHETPSASAAADAHVPPPPQPHAAASTHSAKKSPFHRALASVEAYEHPHRTAEAAPLSTQQLHLEQQAPPPPGPQRQQQQQQTPVVEVAPPVVPPHTEPPAGSSTPLACAHEPAAAASSAPAPARSSPPPPPPPPSQPAPQHPAFSMANMPPPLNYPVFPGAALKRQQK